MLIVKMSSSFYVHLPFHKRKGLLPGKCHYRTWFSKPIILPEADWYVALSSCTYMGQKFSYLDENEERIRLRYSGAKRVNFLSTIGMYQPSVVEVSYQNRELRYVIPQTNYDTERLVKTICNLVNSDTHENKITMTFISPNIIVKLQDTFIDRISVAFYGSVNHLLFSVDTYKHCFEMQRPHEILYIALCPTSRPAISNEENYMIIPTDKNIEIRTATDIVRFDAGLWPSSVFESYLTNHLGIKFYISTINKSYYENQYRHFADVLLKSSDTCEIFFSPDASVFFGIPLSQSVIKFKGEHKFIISWPVDLCENMESIFEIQRNVSSIEHLCACLSKICYNDITLSPKECARFSFSDGQIHVKLMHGVEIKLEPTLMTKLGLSYYKNDWLRKGTDYVGSKIETIAATEIHSFSVISDIIADQFVGNKMLPLLRAVSNIADENLWCTVNLSEHFIAVNKNIIASIDIKVCINDSLFPITFDNDFICTLHFKRI